MWAPSPPRIEEEGYQSSSVLQKKRKKREGNLQAPSCIRAAPTLPINRIPLPEASKQLPFCECSWPRPGKLRGGPRSSVSQNSPGWEHRVEPEAAPVKSLACYVRLPEPLLLLDPRGLCLQQAPRLVLNPKTQTTPQRHMPGRKGQHPGNSLCKAPGA